MTRYRCLVLDHDDTSVQSTPTVHYPAYVETMRRLRPQLTPATREEFTRLWFESRFMETCRDVYRFTPKEMQFQDDNWKEFMQQRVPEFFDGLPQIIRQQRADHFHLAFQIQCILGAVASLHGFVDAGNRLRCHDKQPCHFILQRHLGNKRFIQNSIQLLFGCKSRLRIRFLRLDNLVLRLKQIVYRGFLRRRGTAAGRLSRTPVHDVPHAGSDNCHNQTDKQQKGKDCQYLVSPSSFPS